MFHYANGGFDSDNIKSQSHLLLKCIGEHVREKGLSKVGNLWQRPQMLSMTFLVPGLVEAKDVFLKNLPVSHRMWVNSQRWVTHSYSRSLRRPEIIRLWTCNSPTPRLASESGRLIYRANCRFHSFPWPAVHTVRVWDTDSSSGGGWKPRFTWHSGGTRMDK